MQEKLELLLQHVDLWRSRNVVDYWLRASYLGGELNRMGDHVLSYASGRLYQEASPMWVEIEKGKDFWLFSVPGTFAWARDMIVKVAPADPSVTDASIIIEFDEEFGFVRLLKVAVGKRASANFTYEVRAFGVGVHERFLPPV